MSQVSERRLKELGDGLRKIDGFGGASVKIVRVKSPEKVSGATALQRKAGVANLVTMTAKPNVDGGAPAVKPSALSGRSMQKARWVREKFLINAVFV